MTSHLYVYRGRLSPHLVFVVLWICNSGCAAPGPLMEDTTYHRQYIIGSQYAGQKSTLSPAARGQRNLDLLYEQYKEEIEWRGNLPGKCLALSGGGVRSALFSLGVLKALSDYHQLDSLDIISSVSGGGYALGWYYSQMARLLMKGPGYWDGNSRPIFTESSWNKLRDNIANNYSKSPLRLIQDTASAALSIPFSIATSFNLFEYLNSHMVPPESTAYWVYRYKLETTFLGRQPGDLSYSNSVKLSDLATFISQYNLPMPLINATVEDPISVNPVSPYRIFEFTPFDYGAVGTGYVTCPKKDRLYSGDCSPLHHEEITLGAERVNEFGTLAVGI